MGVQASQDAAHHGSVHGHHPAHAGQHQFGASPASSSLEQHVPCAETPPHQPQWSHLNGVCPTDHFLRGAYVPYRPETMHGAGAYANPPTQRQPLYHISAGGRRRGNHLQAPHTPRRTPHLRHGTSSTTSSSPPSSVGVQRLSSS